MESDGRAKKPGTRYRIVRQADLTYGVEIATGTTTPAIAASFATEIEARTWILAQTHSETRQKMQELGEKAIAELRRRGTSEAEIQRALSGTKRKKRPKP